MAGTSDKAIKIFYSYAPEDEPLRIKLEKQLSNLRQQGLITEWHQGKVEPGSNRADAINSHLDAASLILLLISPDFMASDDCLAQMERAMKMRMLHNAIVIPILLRPTLYDGNPFTNLQVLPRNTQPITTWSDPGEGFFDVAREIQTVIEGLTSFRNPPLPITPSANAEREKESLPKRGGMPHRSDMETTTFQSYRDGLDRLLKELKIQRHPRYAEAARLAKNMKQELRQGSSFKERSELLHALNGLAIETINISFNELCGLSITYSDMEQAHDSLRVWLPYSKFNLITEQRTEEFIGRKFLFDEVKQHLIAPPFSSGYIVIGGEAGIGKTAFMAALVRRYGWIHHYVSLQYGTAKPEHFLKSICAQLIIRYRVSSDLLEDRRVSPDAPFIDLLSKAVKVADEKRIVLLVDALDEAAYTETDDKQLRYNATQSLSLPPDLPSGVFIIATTRPPDPDHSNRLLPRAIHSKLIPLRGDDPANKLDIRCYIEYFIEKHASVMQQRIAEWRVSRAKFIDDLVTKSQGNFMYIVFMLGDIFDGKITQSTKDDIAFLPAGLKDYYWFHWNRMQASEEFEHLYKPVACFLAASYEPISAEKLAELSDKELGQVRRVLYDWSQFFKITGPKARQYQLYHASFRDFLDDVVDLKSYREQVSRQRFRDMGGDPDALG